MPSLERSPIPINIALFNFTESENDVSVKLQDIKGIVGEKLYSLRNLWEHKDLFPLEGSAILSMTLPPHGSVLLQLK